MAKYICSINNYEYDNEELAREAAIEFVEDCDLIDRIKLEVEVSLFDVINELRKIDSPLYFKLLEAAQEHIFENFFYEEDED